MRGADDNFPEIDRLLGCAMAQCVDLEGFDIGPLMARARGEEISSASRQAVDDHIQGCLNCRVFEAEYRETYAAQVAKPELQAIAASERLAQLMAAGSGRSDGSQAPVDGAVERDRGALWTQLARLMRPSLIAPSLMSLAVALFIILPSNVNPAPAFEATGLRGMIARTMGVAPAAPADGPLRFSPTGHFQVTLRLTGEAQVQEFPPKIMGFSVQNGRLKQLSRKFTPYEVSEPKWASLQVDMEVGKVFVGQVGIQRILFASTRQHTGPELEQMGLAEALKLPDVAWIEHEINIVP